MIERNRFLDAVFILTIWDDVDRVNTDMLRSLNRPVAKILAVHTGDREAKKPIEAQLLLAKGARVMLTANLGWVYQWVNGNYTRHYIHRKWAAFTSSSFREF